MTEKMDVAALPRFERACEACRGFGAEVLVPSGDGARRLCWLCAHAVAEHDAEPGDDASIMAGIERCRGCACTFEQIYPGEVVAQRRASAEVRRGFERNRAELRRAIEDKIVGSDDPREHAMDRHEVRAALSAAEFVRRSTWSATPEQLAAGRVAVVESAPKRCGFPGCAGSDGQPRVARRGERCGHHDGSHRRAAS